MVIPADELEPRPTATSDAKPAAATAITPPKAPGFKVIKDERVTARSMTIEDAVMQLNLVGDDVLVFINASSSNTCVLYRRKDGDYGLIETPSAPAGNGSSGNR
jgi:putative sigma-54 modulation protein